MKTITEFPDLQDLYKSDLQRFESLSDSQEFWLGIAINSQRIIEELISNEDKNNERTCNIFYIGLLNKIREGYGLLEEVSNQIKIPLIEEILKIISEALEYKYSSFPIRQSILSDFINAFPLRSQDQVFDLVTHLWLLPQKILNYFKMEILKKQSIPTISKSLDLLNNLGLVNELNEISNLNNSAKFRLVEGFLNYVAFFAYRYRSRGLEFEDIIQEGNIGLIKAVEKYDVRRGAKFKTFGLWWIRQSITRAIADNSRIIRLPVHIFEEASRISFAKSQYSKKNLSEPSNKKLSELCNIDLDKVEKIIEYLKPLYSFDQLIGCEQLLMESYLSNDTNLNVAICKNCPFMEHRFDSFDGKYVDEFELAICNTKEYFRKGTDNYSRIQGILEKITINHEDDLFHQAYLRSLRSELSLVLESLPPRSREAIELYYGLDGGEQRTLDDVGKIMGVTRERIRQLISGGLIKMRHPKISRFIKI